MPVNHKIYQTDYDTGKASILCIFGKLNYRYFVSRKIIILCFKCTHYAIVCMIRN